ncbi:hypothetical protein D3C73_1030590 [compost metagenome]
MLPIATSVLSCMLVRLLAVSFRRLIDAPNLDWIFDTSSIAVEMLSIMVFAEPEAVSSVPPETPAVPVVSAWSAEKEALMPFRSAVRLPNWLEISTVMVSEDSAPTWKVTEPWNRPSSPVLLVPEVPNRLVPP